MRSLCGCCHRCSSSLCQGIRIRYSQCCRGISLGRCGLGSRLGCRLPDCIGYHQVSIGGYYCIQFIQSGSARIILCRPRGMILRSRCRSFRSSRPVRLLGRCLRSRSIRHFIRYRRGWSRLGIIGSIHGIQYTCWWIRLRRMSRSIRFRTGCIGGNSLICT